MDVTKDQAHMILEMDIGTLENGVNALKREVIKLIKDGHSTKAIMRNRQEILDIVSGRWKND